MIAHRECREWRGETVRKLDHKCRLMLQPAYLSK